MLIYNTKHFNGAIQLESSFWVGDENTLNVTIKCDENNNNLVFHDCVKIGKLKYHLFHSKTKINKQDNTVIVRTTAISSVDGAPIPGLVVIYRFDFDKKAAAFHLSAELCGDTCIKDLALTLLEFTWDGNEAKTYTGYEYDAENKPYSEVFKYPKKRKEDLDYNAFHNTRGGLLFDIVKTKPHGFKKAVGLGGKNFDVTVFGGSPILNIESRFISVFPNLSAYDGDVRYFSGASALGAWFIFQKTDNMFDLFNSLELRSPILPHKTLPFVEETFELVSGKFRSNLFKTKSGVWTNTGNSQAVPLFTVSLFDNEYKRTFKTDSGDGWDKVKVVQSEKYMRVTLSDPQSGRINGISVVAECYCEPSQSKVSWKMRVINRNGNWSVTEASYPQYIACGLDTAYITDGSGIEIKDFNKRCEVMRSRYPTGVKTPNAFAAMYDSNGNGIYMGAHDAQGNVKMFTLAGSRGTNSTLMSAFCCAQYQRHKGNSFTLPGEMIYQAFTGDWYDAANIYKAFVKEHAEWFPKLRGRADRSKWLRECPVWILHFIHNDNPDAEDIPITLRDKYRDKSDDDWYTKAIRFREEIGVPVGYHVYNWHWVPFNNDNPNYFPAYPDFKEGVEKLHNADIKVVPYVSGYSWDKHDRRGGDYRFEKEALPYSAKNKAGEVIVNSHASFEPDGKPVEFARICPTTHFWKDEMYHLTRTLYKDYKVDGIYLDVVSAAYNFCYDETHAHTPGYGDYWWKAYAELIEGIRADAPEDFAIVSESVSEVYATALDGYLAWSWVKENQVPGFPTIYGGRTSLFGRVVTPNKRDDDAYCRFQMAQTFMYGVQLGWIHPEIVDDKKQFPYLKKLAQLRYKYVEFFKTAELLRPPVVAGDMELINCAPFLRGKYWHHEKAVLAAAFEDINNKKCLFVTNSSFEDAEVTLTVNQNEYLLPADVTKFSFADGVTISETKVNGDKAELKLQLKGLAVAVLEW